MPNLSFAVYTPVTAFDNQFYKLANSIKTQNTHLFEWIIIKYGSLEIEQTKIDELKTLIPNLNIKVIQQDFKTRFAATRFAFKNLDYDYLLAIDNEFILAEGAIEFVVSEWEVIKKNKIPIIEIRGLSQDIYGNIICNNLKKLKEKNYLDGSWQKLHLKQKINFEALPSWDLKYVKKYLNLKNCDYLDHKGYEVKTVNIWSSIGLIGNTRVINKVLKIQTILDEKKIETDPDFEIINSFCFLRINMNFFYYSPFVFVKVIYKILSLEIQQMMTFHEQKSHNKK
jgi:hypothetical protein